MRNESIRSRAAPTKTLQATCSEAGGGSGSGDVTCTAVIVSTSIQCHLFLEMLQRVLETSAKRMRTGAGNAPCLVALGQGSPQQLVKNLQEGPKKLR
jgi:hypothetical protein